jgi:hypothetical protein
MFLFDDEPVGGGIDGGVPGDDTGVPTDDSGGEEEVTPAPSPEGEGTDQV